MVRSCPRASTHATRLTLPTRSLPGHIPDPPDSREHHAVSAQLAPPAGEKTGAHQVTVQPASCTGTWQTQVAHLTVHCPLLTLKGTGACKGLH